MTDSASLDHPAFDRDIQMEPDNRGVAIQEVGISHLHFPLQVRGLAKNDDAPQGVSAECSLAVSLAADLKGIHMSRLVEDLIAQASPIAPESLVELLQSLRGRQEAQTASCSVAFDAYFMRPAPVSKLPAPQRYRVEWKAALKRKSFRLVQKLRVPVATLCPCSKEISDYGAHNQRGIVSIKTCQKWRIDAEQPDPVRASDLIADIEQAASAPLYPLLKRVDERYVTMQAYDNPRFVEDLVRNVAVVLEDLPNVDDWKVRVTNEESIHQHNAYAVVRKKTMK